MRDAPDSPDVPTIWGRAAIISVVVVILLVLIGVYAVSQLPLPGTVADEPAPPPSDVLDDAPGPDNRNTDLPRKVIDPPPQREPADAGALR